MAPGAGHAAAGSLNETPRDDSQPPRMLDLVIDKRKRDLGGFEVGRVLPFSKRRMVGPFIFLDHMGPVEFAPGLARRADVRPHPHIGLSTVTYLFRARSCTATASAQSSRSGREK